MKYQSLLTEKLTAALAPTHLEIANESSHHGLKPEAEKHFRVVAVSPRFANLSRIERHRLVHEVVAEELKTHVHALSVQAYTPEEWSAKGGQTFASPECQGGSKHPRRLV